VAHFYVKKSVTTRSNRPLTALRLGVGWVGHSLFHPQHFFGGHRGGWARRSPKMLALTVQSNVIMLLLVNQLSDYY